MTTPDPRYGKIETETEFNDFKNIVKKGKYFSGFIILYDKDGIFSFSYYRNERGRKLLQPLLRHLSEKFGIKHKRITKEEKG